MMKENDWKLLDGGDIEWTLKDTIAAYERKIVSGRIRYNNIFDFSKVSSDLKQVFLSGKFFIEKKDKTDTSLFEKELGYKMPQDIEEYLNSYWHPGIFGFSKFPECICLSAVVKYENENADDVLFNKHGIVYWAKQWRDVFDGNINEYLPIGSLMSPELMVLYEVKTGRIFMEDIDNEGNPEKAPFENSLKELIQHLEPIKPAYMSLKFELEDIENPKFEKGDFQYEVNLGIGQFYNVLADGRPYLQVEADPKRLYETAVIYYHYLLVGTYDKVYFIDLWELSDNTYPVKVDVEMYFRSFVTTPDEVYVLDGTGIIAFNADLIEKWRNHNLAVINTNTGEVTD